MTKRRTGEFLTGRRHFPHHPGAPGHREIVCKLYFHIAVSGTNLIHIFLANHYAHQRDMLSHHVTDDLAPFKVAARKIIGAIQQEGSMRRRA